MLLETRNKPFKWSKDEKDEIIEYHFDHGESVTNARRKLVIHLIHLKIMKKKNKGSKVKHKVHKKATIFNERRETKSGC